MGGGVGDFDKDADLDVLVSGSDGTNYQLRTYSNNGNGTFNATATNVAGLNGGVGYSSVAVGDYDVDGNLDILVAGRTSGLAGYWNLDENAGTSAFDLSGNASTGTLTNGPTWGTGKSGSGIVFDGNNDYVTMGDPASGILDPSGSFTLSVWVKTTQSLSGGNYAAIAGKGFLASAIGHGLFLSGDYSSRPVYQTRYNLTAPHVVHGSSISDGNWHLLTGVRDHPTSTTYFYVDGQISGSSVTALSGYSSNNSFGLGRRHDGSWGYSYNGTIDDVRFYTRALSAGEVARLYQATRISIGTLRI
ncbi:MAG: VCBS repeat-containing protein, partial [Elusimicrobia bacterium]|nr:VCBS repeat-containing protein [Elusimicrobiota bacterium]